MSESQKTTDKERCCFGEAWSEWRRQMNEQPGSWVSKCTGMTSRMMSECCRPAAESKEDTQKTGKG
jgi:hypothetical protein